MGSREKLQFRADDIIAETVENMAEYQDTSRSAVLRDFVDLALFLYHPNTTVGEVLADDVIDDMGIDSDTPFREVVDPKPDVFDMTGE